MKKYILPLMLLTTFAHANVIEGTQVLKGSLKTKITLNGISTTCSASVKKVTNDLTREDAFGNPAYLVRYEVELRGENVERKINNKFDQKVVLTNMYEVNGKLIVKDLDYAAAAENVFLKIDSDGRLKETSFIFKNQKVVCKF